MHSNIVVSRQTSPPIAISLHYSARRRAEGRQVDDDDDWTAPPPARALAAPRLQSLLSRATNKVSSSPADIPPAKDASSRRLVKWSAPLRENESFGVEEQSENNSALRRETTSAVCAIACSRPSASLIVDVVVRYQGLSVDLSVIYRFWCFWYVFIFRTERSTSASTSSTAAAAAAFVVVVLCSRHPL